MPSDFSCCNKAAASSLLASEPASEFSEDNSPDSLSSSEDDFGGFLDFLDFFFFLDFFSWISSSDSEDWHFLDPDALDNFKDLRGIWFATAKSAGFGLLSGMEKKGLYLYLFYIFLAMPNLRKTSETRKMKNISTIQRILGSRTIQSMNTQDELRKNKSHSNGY